MSASWLTSARRIAVVRLDRLGDMFLTFPMFRALRQHAPGAELHLICRPYTAPAADGVDCIDRVHTVPTSDSYGELEVIFRRERLDVVFFPLWIPGHAWAARRAGVRHRVGTGRRLFGLLYTHWIWGSRSSRTGKHEAALNNEMVADMLGHPVQTELVAPVVAPGTIASLEARLAGGGVAPGAPLLVVHPGSGGSTPATWPAERFAEVARTIAAERGFTVVVTGSEAEAPLVDAVVRTCPGAIPLTGMLTLPELIALVSRARLLLTNSTGPLHVATAYDTPVVGAFPGTDVARWRPLSPRGGWVASAMHADDLEGITVEVFLNEARRVVALPAAAGILPDGGPLLPLRNRVDVNRVRRTV